MFFKLEYKLWTVNKIPIRNEKDLKEFDSNVNKVKILSDFNTFALFSFGILVTLLDLRIAYIGDKDIYKMTVLLFLGFLFFIDIMSYLSILKPLENI